MTHREMIRQGKIIKNILERDAKILSQQGGAEKLMKMKKKMHKRQARQDIIFNFLDWFSESSARVMVAFLVLAIISLFLPYFIVMRLPQFILDMGTVLSSTFQ